MSNLDAFWAAIARSYTEEDLRELDRLWSELRWVTPERSSIPGVVERVKRWTER